MIYERVAFQNNLRHSKFQMRAQLHGLGSSSRGTCFTHSSEVRNEPFLFTLLYMLGPVSTAICLYAIQKSSPYTRSFFVIKFVSSEKTRSCYTRVVSALTQTILHEFWVDLTYDLLEEWMMNF